MKIDTDVEKFSRNDYIEIGNFVNQTYYAELLKRKKKLQLVLHRDGRVWINNVWSPILLAKSITFSADSSAFDIAYRIENRSESRLESLFGVETAWALLAGNSQDRYYHVDGVKPENYSMVSMGVIPESETLSIRDEAFGYDIRLKADRKLDWWRFPIETVSLSESGFERNYQQSTVVPVVKLDLTPGSAFDLKLSIEISKL